MQAGSCRPTLFGEFLLFSSHTVLITAPQSGLGDTVFEPIKTIISTLCQSPCAMRFRNIVFQL